MGREVWQSGDFRFAGGVGGSHHHRVNRLNAGGPESLSRLSSMPPTDINASQGNALGISHGAVRLRLHLLRVLSSCETACLTADGSVAQLCIVHGAEQRLARRRSAR